MIERHVTEIRRGLSLITGKIACGRELEIRMHTTS
jgi:hypothetical protein